jgi:hypothetical protein
MRHAALLLAVALAAGCTAPAPGQDDAPSTSPSPSLPPPTGTDAAAGPFLLVMVGNKDSYNTPEEVRKDRHDTVDRQGRMLHFVGDPRAGTGRVAGPDSAFVNVTREQVLAHLQAIGKWNASQDHAVDVAWRAAVPRPQLDNLSTVLDEERELPEDTSPYRVGCADGGSVHIRVSDPEGDWERTIGCLPDQSQAESASGHRILQAFHAAKEAARKTLDA